jgi:hypothetical protein
MWRKKKVCAADELLNFPTADFSVSERAHTQIIKALCLKLHPANDQRHRDALGTTS